MDGGDEPERDLEQVRLLRAQARRIYVESAVLGALLTGLALLASVWARG